jgi:hypothetical protein
MLRPMPKALNLMVRLLAGCMTFLSLASCGGGDDKDLAGYSEECSVDDDCQVDLICVGAPLGICTLPCDNNGPCLAKRASSICNDGFCYDSCTPETQACPNPELKCTMNFSTQGTCRVPR